MWWRCCRPATLGRFLLPRALFQADISAHYVLRSRRASAPPPSLPVLMSRRPGRHQAVRRSSCPQRRWPMPGAPSPHEEECCRQLSAAVGWRACGLTTGDRAASGRTSPRPAFRRRRATTRWRCYTARRQVRNIRGGLLPDGSSAAATPFPIAVWCCRPAWHRWHAAGGRPSAG